MIKEIKITVQHQHLDWNHPAHPGGTTPLTYTVTVEVNAPPGDAQPPPSTEVLKVLTTAITMVLNGQHT